METLRAPFYTLPDTHGGPMVEFLHHPEEETLQLRWHGHLTAEDVVQAGKLSLEYQPGLHYRRLFNDKSQASGDWHEAMPWLHYEWLPHAIAGGLRAMSYVFSPDPVDLPGSYAFISLARSSLAIEAFYNTDEAWRWLLAH